MGHLLQWAYLLISVQDAKASSVGISSNSGGGGSVNMWMITLDAKASSVSIAFISKGGVILGWGGLLLT